MGLQYSTSSEPVRSVLVVASVCLAGSGLERAGLQMQGWEPGWAPL